MKTINTVSLNTALKFVASVLLAVASQSSLADNSTTSTGSGQNNYKNLCGQIDAIQAKQNFSGLQQIQTACCPTKRGFTGLTRQLVNSCQELTGDSPTPGVSDYRGVLFSMWTLIHAEADFVVEEVKTFETKEKFMKLWTDSTLVNVNSDANI